MNTSRCEKETAIWAVTPNGAELALRLSEALGDADVFLSGKAGGMNMDVTGFTRISEILPEKFPCYKGHIFIMSTGIVVRQIAPLLESKTSDPAVVVVDELGHHAVSLVSGHLGGANELAGKAARAVGAVPVITTATDLNNLPAIDMIARDKNLVIENPDAVKQVGMAFLAGRRIRLHDPYGLTGGRIPVDLCLPFASSSGDQREDDQENPGIWVDDTGTRHPDNVLRLRPLSLAAGIGCNRGTQSSEILSLVEEVFRTHDLSLKSLACLASISIKQDEKGLLDAALALGVQAVFYEKETLSKVKGIQSPSGKVEKYTGVKSVCEAAAIQSANGTLIVRKHKTQNVTVAVARKINFT